MWDLETINRMNADAAIMARGKKKRPFKIESKAQLKDMPPFPFPELGDAVDDFDEEYERLDSLFCDHSGWGSPGEPALTPEQLRSKLFGLVDKHGVIYTAIESIGQFQLHLAVWKEKSNEG